jgi:hypothetical protein
MPQIYNTEWRAEHGATKYPFAQTATLVSRDGRVIPEGTFLDAAICPAGGQTGLRLTRVSLDHDAVTIAVGDQGDLARCTGSFPLAEPPDAVALVDVNGRAAGLLVSEPQRLAALASFGIGDHLFASGASEFVASVCFPTPAYGVQGFVLPDGTVLAGEVFFVGEAGVVFREEDSTPGPCNGQEGRVIRIDAVGDPLMRRRLCAGSELYLQPRFITRVRFVHQDGHFTCTPDEHGALRIDAGDFMSSDTVLRVTPVPSGVAIGLAGT